MTALQCSMRRCLCIGAHVCVSVCGSEFSTSLLWLFFFFFHLFEEDLPISLMMVIIIIIFLHSEFASHSSQFMGSIWRMNDTLPRNFFKPIIERQNTQTAKPAIEENKFNYSCYCHRNSMIKLPTKRFLFCFCLSFFIPFRVFFHFQTQKNKKQLVNINFSSWWMC